MGSTIVVAVVTGFFALIGVCVTAVVGLVAARKARDAERDRERAERERDREQSDREQATRVMELYGRALEEERQETARLRAELRRKA